MRVATFISASSLLESDLEREIRETDDAVASTVDVNWTDRERRELLEIARQAR